MWCRVSLEDQALCLGVFPETGKYGRTNPPTQAPHSFSLLIDLLVERIASHWGCDTVVTPPPCFGTLPQYVSLVACILRYDIFNEREVAPVPL